MTMSESAVLDLLGAFAEAGAEVWLDGGWGVDALLGRQTREHGDLDIVCLVQDVTRLRAVLSRLRFADVETDDRRPHNFVMQGPGDQRVDFHVIAVGADGRGVYGPPEDGAWYPAASLRGEGMVGGRVVRCTSAAFQIVSHTGYAFDDDDVADVLALHRAFGIDLPPAYRRAALGHVTWIGGGSGAGKSTIARRLADRYGLRVYSTDDAMADHARRSSPERAPLLADFRAMTMDERWVDRTPRAMADTFPWFHGEAFDAIIDDLLDRGGGGAVVAEGFRLLPRLVQPWLTRGKAVWLLPTPDFRAAVFARRGVDFLDRTRDPALGLRKLQERDRVFTDHVRRETLRLRLPAIEVDGAQSEAHLADTVAEALGL